MLLFTRVRFVCSAVAIMLLAACAPSGGGEAVKAATLKPADKRKPAPEFSLKDSNGQAVKLSDYKGKVVLLNFWATWCGPCKIEIPWFVEFEQQFKDRGFSVIGVAMDEEGWDVVRPYIAAKRVNYRILMGTDMVAELYGGVDSLPTTFLIDREGKIASVHVGLVGKNDYKNEIVELLDTSKRVSAGFTSVPAALVAGAN